MLRWMLGALVTGCVVVDEPFEPVPEDGQISVTWQVGPAGCEGSGVSTVEIAYGDEVESFACEDEAATLSARPGNTSLTLFGLDDRRVARYGGEATAAVYSGQVTSVPTVVLSALPATVVATWRFENGLLCTPNGVETVELNLFDADDQLEQTLEAPCDDGLASLVEVDAGAHTLLVLGRDATGTVTYSGGAAFDAEKGDTVEAEIVLAEE